MADRHADILGIGNVRPDGSAKRRSDEEGVVHESDEGHLSSTTGEPDPHGDSNARAGNRDVTGGRPGGTGTDTGGSGVYRRGSGAKPVDIGE